MEETRKPVVVVTGSSGLIGSRVARRLSTDFEVVGFDVDRPEGGDSKSEVEWIACDLTKNESVLRAFEMLRVGHGTRIASVIHLAAYYDFSGADSPLYEDLTIEGTRRLLHALSVFEVEQLIFSSTLLVMKASESGEVVSERSPIDISWNYPASKVIAENVIHAERGSIPALILRIAGVYDEDCNSIPIAQHIKRIHERSMESYFFPGDQDHGQPFIHLDDLTEAIETAIVRRSELPPYELLLIAEPDLMSHRDLQNTLGTLIHGRPWPTIRIPKPVAKLGAWVKDRLAKEGEEPFIKPWMVDLADADYPVALQRARARLGFSPRHRLKETLPQMIAFLKRDPRRFYDLNKLGKTKRHGAEKEERAA